MIFQTHKEMKHLVKNLQEDRTLSKQIFTYTTSLGLCATFTIHFPIAPSLKEIFASHSTFLWNLKPKTLLNRTAASDDCHFPSLAHIPWSLLKNH